MQPLQYDWRSSAAKDNSITHAAAAPSNLEAATTMRSAETELQNTIELRATVSEIAPPKPDLDARKKNNFEALFKRIFKKKITSVKIADFLPTTRSMQHSCTHSNAICNHSFKKRIERRTQEQPLLQNT